MAEHYNGKYSHRPEKRKKKKRLSPLIIILIIVACLVIAIFAIEKSLGGSPADPVPSETTAPTTAPTEPPTEPPITKTSTATISSMGDLLMHLPVINAYKSGDGYDFTGMFQYVKPYLTKADYAVANLETTLFGTGMKYSGYPNFNCPDEIVDGALDAGIDMLLNANNHSTDTGAKGIARTIEVLDEKGMERNGIAKDASEKRYVVKNLNGIKVGLICYTYETNDDPVSVALNGIPLAAPYDDLANTFAYGELDTFYANLTAQLDLMKADGAEATVVYLHWGVEYQLSANDSQKAIAQKLCDLGVDVIIGGHPHVVQPVELLSSNTDPEHKTVCLYSMGNAVSNQRLGNISNIKTAHTEDGVLFSVTFAKYSNGDVLLESVNALPLWVNLYTTASGGKAYEILPLDDQVDDWRTTLDLSDKSEAACRASYVRTMELVEKGILAGNEYLDSVIKPDSEAYKALKKQVAA